jgi:hypothetical protein
VEEGGLIYAQLSSVNLLDGQTTYCKDCRANAATTQCEGGGGGAFARHEGGTWKCSGGEVTPSGSQPLTNKDLSSPTNILPPVPRDVVIHANLNDNTPTIWANMPSAITELFNDSQWRMKLDLGGAAQFRLVAIQGGVGAPGSKLRVQYSTDQITWSDLENRGMTGDLALATTGATQLVIGEWGPITDAAKGDVFLRVVGLNGNGKATSAWFSIRMQLK